MEESVRTDPEPWIGKDLLSLALNRDAVYKANVPLTNLVTGDDSMLKRVKLEVVSPPSAREKLVSKAWNAASKPRKDSECEKGVPSALVRSRWSPSEEECLEMEAGEARMEALRHVPETKEKIALCPPRVEECSAPAFLKGYLLSHACAGDTSTLVFHFEPSTEQARWIANVCRIRDSVTHLVFYVDGKKKVVSPREPIRQHPFRGAFLGEEDKMLKLAYNAVTTSLTLNNGIGGELDDGIVTALFINPNLKRLKLINVGLLQTEDRIREKIEVNDSLEEMELSHCHLTYEGGISILKALKNGRLPIFRIAFSFWDGDGVNDAICDVLRSNSGLRTLDLKSCKRKGLSKILEALKDNMSLSEFRIDNLGYGAGRDICDLLRRNSSLTCLGVAECDLDVADCVEIANELANNTTLSEMHMHNNDVGPDGGKALGEALRVNSSLQTLIIAETYLALADVSTLDINEFKVGDVFGYEGREVLVEIGVKGDKEFVDLSGVYSIADSLRVNTTLTYLHIAGNYLGRKGGIAIVNALRKNSTLKKLYIASTGLTGQVIVALADVVRKNSSLEDLDIGDVKVGDTASRKMAEAVLESESMETFNGIPMKKMRENALTELNVRDENDMIGGIVLARLLRYATRLVSLEIDDMSRKGAKALADAISNNEASHLKRLIVYDDYPELEVACHLKGIHLSRE